MTQLVPDRTASTRPYRLCALLAGHTSDVRSLSSTCDSTPGVDELFSASRDSSARRWCRSRTSRGEWQQVGAYTGGHEGFVNAVAVVPPRRGEHTGYVATAGSDSLIQLYPLARARGSTSEPEPPSPAPRHTLLGHLHNVCAVSSDSTGERLASASWDMTARIWTRSRRAAGPAGGEERVDDAWECTAVLTDHTAAVWDVLLVEGESDLVLTAAADNYVRLFERSKTRSVFKGHTGPVRALARLVPDDPTSTLFASASNDGTIRIWDYRTGDALSVLRHDDFVYSLATIPPLVGGGLASSGEDGLVKVWNEETGECDQVVEVPALSVWSLATLSNGDLACGCSDNLIWVFTRDEERLASPDVLEQYQSKMANLRRVKTSAGKGEARPIVHDPAVLNAVGEAEGQVKLVRHEGSSVLAHQWTGTEWSTLGEVVDDAAGLDSTEPTRDNSPPSNRTVHEGAEYDFVFQIDVKDDEPPLPLPYNVDDDVVAVARDFVAEHALPDSYVERIVDFIRVSTQ
ncbi:hypothetical protein JCM10212_004487 [Sporobolomyces blumeae]